MSWKKQEFEVSSEPAEGEKVQYIAVYILKWAKMCKEFGIPKSEVEFYLREVDNE